MSDLAKGGVLYSDLTEKEVDVVPILNGMKEMRLYINKDTIRKRTEIVEKIPT